MDEATLVLNLIFLLVKQVGRVSDLLFQKDRPSLDAADVLIKTEHRGQELELHRPTSHSRRLFILALCSHKQLEVVVFRNVEYHFNLIMINEAIGSSIEMARPKSNLKNQSS